MFVMLLRIIVGNSSIVDNLNSKATFFLRASSVI